MATVLEPLGDGFEARSQTRLRVFEEGEGGDMDIQYGRMGDDYRDDNEATTEKELTPIVAMPPPSAAVTVNRLSKQTYSRLGRNSSFEVRPAVSSFPASFFCAERMGNSTWTQVLPTGVQCVSRNGPVYLEIHESDTRYIRQHRHRVQVASWISSSVTPWSC